jgi:flavin-dependent dehydrogenase
MTRRRKLDAFLAERAVDIGAEFRDGARVTALEAARTRTTVCLGRERAAASVVVGADGVNGVSARALGADRARVQTVALEGNAVLLPTDEGRYRGRIVIELATVPGGYGWVFAKGDHLNVGVWGWESQGPSLRERLARLCCEHGLDPAGLRDVRGYRLPLRWPNATLTTGCAVLVGDAAGLVDPFTGDGIFEAVLSATLASQTALAFLGGAATSLAPYADRLVSSLEPLATASWRVKLAFDRFPSLGFALARAPLAWWVGERLLRGELADPRPSGVRALLSQRTLELLGARRSPSDGRRPVAYGA